MMNRPSHDRGQPVNILHIEGSAADADQLQALLQPSAHWDYRVQHASSLHQAIDLLGHRGFDLIILDMQLPDGHGLEILDALHDHIDQAAILALSSIDDSELALDALRHGAEEYLVKQHTGAARLLRCIDFALSRHHGPQYKPVWNNSFVKRRAFAAALESKLDLREELQRSHAALFRIQLENIDTLADVYNEDLIEMLLDILIKRINRSLEEDCLAYRTEKNQLLVLYNPVEPVQCIQATTEAILRKLSHPFKIGQTALFLLPTIGVAPLSQDDYHSAAEWCDASLIACQIARAEVQPYYISSLGEADVLSA